MNRTCSAIAISLIALFYFRCTNLTGGTGEETTNGRVIGSLMNEDGKPANRAVVSLVPDAYNPNVDIPLPDSHFDTTDAAGRFSLRTAGKGNYNIQAADSVEKNKLLITDIQVEQTEMMDVPPHSFLRPGSLRIIIRGFQVQEGSYVYLPGTLFSRQVENDTAFFNSVPAGIIPSAIFVSSVDNTPSHVIQTGIAVASGDTTTISCYPGWKYSKRLFLNTTCTGVYVASTVYGFPVLIRLSWRNFDFNQADGNGKDVRFAKSDGTPLPFEIERWDPSWGLAEVWVKVDTLRGNNSTQSITMFYGNPDAANESRGAAVFDTANGFMGVWHLNESGGQTAFDATLNRYDGIFSPSGPAAVSGNINMARHFDGKSDYITMPNTANSRINFPENGNYSISVWVSIDMTMPSRQAILSKGDLQYSLAIKDSFCAFTEFQNMIGWETARSTPAMTFINVPAKTWILVTGVRAGNRQYLFIDDGLCTSNTNEFIASVKSRLTGLDVSIGRIENPDTTSSSYFAGKIDEVRIYNVALTEDWIRLCFNNQIWNGALVKFE